MGEWRGIELTGVSLAEPGAGPLRLRPYRETDVPRSLAAMQDRTMHAFLPLPDPYTEADAREFCCAVAPAKAERGAGMELAMVGADDLVIGGAGLTLPGPRDAGAEIGYSVHADARGHGHATRAARLLAAWAFAHDVPRVEIRAALGNTASQRTALRAGFGFEGVRRLEVLTPSGASDGAAFARVAADPGEPVPAWLPPMTDVGDDVLRLRPMLGTDRAAMAGRLPASAVEGAPLGWLVGPSTLVAAVDVATGDVAGHLQLRAGPTGVIELGYGVLPVFRDRGFAVRALRLFAAWAFGPGGSTLLELGAGVDDGVSPAVAERAGFAREGVTRHRLRRPPDVGAGRR